MIQITWPLIKMGLAILSGVSFMAFWAILARDFKWTAGVTLFWLFAMVHYYESTFFYLMSFLFFLLFFHLYFYDVYYTKEIAHKGGRR